MNDLTLLARYWMSLFDNEQPPQAVMVGAEADIGGTADSFGVTAVENLAWLTGYAVYPVGGVYAGALFPAIDGEKIGWFHCVVTRETIVMIGDQELEGDPPDMFLPLVAAAHDFDQYPIENNEGFTRQISRTIMERNNGVGHHITMSPPGSYLAAASAWWSGF